MSNDGFGQLFEIPEKNWGKFEKEIEKLSKKAMKLVGEPITADPIGKDMKDLGNGTMIQVLQVFVAGPEPKLNGWMFVARLDHANETGNIVRVVPGETLPEHFRCSNPNCEHCGINRYRRDTYVLKNIETTEYKQVGSSCLRDFLGHGDPEKYAKLAELLSYAVEHAKAAGHYTREVGEDLRYIHLPTFLGYVAANTRKHGYVGRPKARELRKTATCDLSYNNMMYYLDSVLEEDMVTDADRDLAEKAAEWAQDLAQRSDLSDYEHNISVIAASGIVELRNIGFAASIVGAYLRNHKVTPHKPVEGYVGEPGKKMEVTVTIKNDPSKAKINSKFGDSYLHIMEDGAGNKIVWYAQRPTYSKDATVRISAKVKAHGEYQGKKQTTVTHVEGV